MLKSGLGWDLSVNKGQPKNVYGARVWISNDDHISIRVGTVTMSKQARRKLTADIGPIVLEHCSNQLPNLLSIYQFLILLEKQLKLAKYNAKNLDFDISKTSGFRLVFDKMVSEMGTAAGLVITKNAMPWEWELYRRILDGERQLPKVDFVRNSLGDKNKEILELRKKFVPQDGLENGLKENPPPLTNPPLPTNPPLHMNPSPPSNPPPPSPRTTPPHTNTPLVPKKQSKDQTWDEWINWDARVIVEEIRWSNPSPPNISFLPPFKSVILIAVMVLVTTLKTLPLYILFPILFGVTVHGHPILSERVTSMQPTQDQADGLRRVRSPLANAPGKKVPTTPYAIRFSYKDYKRLQTIPKLPDNTYDWSVLSLAEKVIISVGTQRQSTYSARMNERSDPSQNINWPWEGYHPPLSITVSDSMALGHIDLLRGDISLSKGDARRALDEKLDQVPFQGYIGHTRAAMSLLRDERYIPAALVTSFLKGTQEIADKEAEALKEMYRSMVLREEGEVCRQGETEVGKEGGEVDRGRETEVDELEVEVSQVVFQLLPFLRC
ncbi:hypothetical protein EV360DRAFT_75445 [Lentinula raphanica]|nr:hypothetical protein EV360DRAFT_75445 [Lentinula raphanica]